MEFTYFLNAIMANVDPVAAALVLISMGVLRYVLPAPEAADSRMDVTPWVNRYVLPLLPYPLGVACFLLVKGNVSMEWTAIVVKGVLSGGLADIAYRKFKVMILGA